jgi:hypothetical protein
MKKTAVDPALLQLLVSIYNQSIQTYFYFPEVIICGRQRLEREDVERLLALHFLQPYKTDSFGRWYRLSKRGEAFLLQSLFRRRQKTAVSDFPVVQHKLPFFESC